MSLKPKLAIGYRGAQLPKGKLQVYVKNWRCDYSLPCCLAGHQKRYQQLYESGQIDDSFDFEIEVCPDFQFLIISLDTLEPIAMANNICQYLNKVSQSSNLDDLSEKHFEIVKKELYGDFFKSLDSIDNLSAQFINHLSANETYLDVPKILATLGFAESLENR
mgnify:CR=1 FL=1